MSEEVMREAIEHLRPTVRWFAEQMETKLRENDHKGGWEHESRRALFERLIEEAKELNGCGQFDYPEAVGEAVDVANFAMMIADNDQGMWDALGNIDAMENRGLRVRRTDKLSDSLSSQERS